MRRPLSPAVQQPGASGSAGILTLLFGLAVLLAAQGAVAADCGQQTVGLNKFDLALQYLGRASGGDGSAAYVKVERAMAAKAIGDAAAAGATYLRVSATGFRPSAPGQRGDLELWLRNPSEYWAAIDLMMHDLEAAHLCLIPVFDWNPVQFPAMTSESLDVMIRDPQSRSWQLLERYVRDFITRYHARSNLLFYELTNELNNHADIDAARACSRGKPADACALMGNFSTDDMNRFMARFAGLVRSLDGAHRISSGFTIPRPAAQHLRRRPQWSPHGADWTPDSATELAAQLRDIHASVDIVSVHLYLHNSERLGLSGGEAYKIVEIVAAAAASSGKPLFIGEFGQRGLAEASADSYPAKVLAEIVRLHVPYSAPWVWEFYQRGTDLLEPTFALEPGTNDSLIERLGAANAARRPQAAAADGDAAPTVVLTQPLECASIGPGSQLYAVSSSGRYAPGAVDFLLDGKPIGQVAQPPYRLALPASAAAGMAEIEARACSRGGKCQSYKTHVVLGQDDGARQRCESRFLGPNA